MRRNYKSHKVEIDFLALHQPVNKLKLRTVIREEFFSFGYILRTVVISSKRQTAMVTLKNRQAVTETRVLRCFSCYCPINPVSFVFFKSEQEIIK